MISRFEIFPNFWYNLNTVTINESLLMLLLYFPWLIINFSMLLSSLSPSFLKSVMIDDLDEEEDMGTDDGVLGIWDSLLINSSHFSPTDEEEERIWVDEVSVPTFFSSLAQNWFIKVPKFVSRTLRRYLADPSSASDEKETNPSFCKQPSLIFISKQVLNCWKRQHPLDSQLDWFPNVVRIVERPFFNVVRHVSTSGLMIAMHLWLRRNN